MSPLIGNVSGMSLLTLFIQFMTVREISTNILVTKLAFKKQVPEFMSAYLEMGIAPLESNLEIHINSLAIFT